MEKDDMHCITDEFDFNDSGVSDWDQVFSCDDELLQAECGCMPQLAVPPGRDDKGLNLKKIISRPDDPQQMNISGMQNPSFHGKNADGSQPCTASENQCGNIILKEHTQERFTTDQMNFLNTMSLKQRMGDTSYKLSCENPVILENQETSLINPNYSSNGSMITSSQEISESETMIISSQEISGSEKMVISSQEISKNESMIISSQEISESQKMIVSSQESSENQKMIISSQESSASQKMNVSSHENSLNKGVSSWEKYSTDLKGPHKLLNNEVEFKTVYNVGNTVNESSLGNCCRKCNKVCKNKIMNARKRELIVARREKSVEDREKQLLSKEISLHKREENLKRRYSLFQKISYLKKFKM